MHTVTDRPLPRTPPATSRPASARAPWVAPRRAAVPGRAPAAAAAVSHGDDGAAGSGSDGDWGEAASASSGSGSGGSSSGAGSSRRAGSSGAAVEPRQAWHRPDVAVVLVHPQIPQNTGNVARTCAATGTPLHLVGPLGFELDDRKLKRAGLDYWDAVCVNVHDSWGAFYDYFASQPGPKRLVAYTVYGDTYYGAPEFTYQSGDWLVFGAETSGLPPAAHSDVTASGGALVKIPIRDTHVRSINLAVAAGVGLFEAIRQLDAGTHAVAPRATPTLEEVAAAHVDGKPRAAPVQRQG